MSQRASGYSIVGVAAVVIFERGDAITKAGIALTGVGEAPYRARGVEAALIGTDGGTTAIASAAAHATDGVTVGIVRWGAVGGVKMPFAITFSWLDGRENITLTDVQVNVPVDAAKFGEPATVASTP